MIFNTISNSLIIISNNIIVNSKENETTPSPPTKSSGFIVFDSSRLLILKGGNSHVRKSCIGSLPESLTRGLLVGNLLVGGLGVLVII